MSEDQEPVLIRVGRDNGVSLVEDTERGRELIVLFMQNNMLMRVLPEGIYRFNVVNQGGQKIITTCDSIEAGPIRIHMDMRDMGSSASLNYSITSGEEFDWKKHRKYIGALVLILGLITILMAIPTK